MVGDEALRAAATLATDIPQLRSSFFFANFGLQTYYRYAVGPLPYYNCVDYSLSD